jgi:hypothetical protein
MMVYVYQRQNLTVPSVFQATAKKYPNRVCLYFEDEAWTFKQVKSIESSVIVFLMTIEVAQMRIQCCSKSAWSLFG